MEMFLGQCVHNLTTNHGLEVSMFLAGLVGGVSHCSIMCSPFVLAQLNDSKEVPSLSSRLLLPYHAGRMTTYIVLAVLLNSVINLAFLYSDLKAVVAAPMLVLAGVIFLVSAFPRLSVIFPWAANVRVSAPYRLISKFSERLTKSSGFVGRYALGLLLGFMPCGLVISALLASATAPTITQAALAMAAFAVGTVPALMVVAFGGQSLRVKYPALAQRLSKGAMLVSGVWLFALAGMMIL